MTKDLRGKKSYQLKKRIIR